VITSIKNGCTKANLTIEKYCKAGWARNGATCLTTYTYLLKNLDGWTFLNAWFVRNIVVRTSDL